MVRKGYLLALEHIGPELIDFYPVDAFVNTACPRIAIDDSVKYGKPLVTPFELKLPWERRSGKLDISSMRYLERGSRIESSITIDDKAL